MAQKTINIGTVANDSTGDTLRGAFANTNNNFTELYNNHANVTANIVSVAVAGNNWTNTVSVAVNTYIVHVGTMGNNFTSQVGRASNTWANTVGIAGNNYAIQVGAASNVWANTVGTAGNNYAIQVGAASNVWANTVGTAGNNYSDSVAIAGNNYTVQVGAASNTWANTNFYTISNGSSSFSHANAAFNKANNSLENTTVTLAGSLTSTAFYDTIGFLRDYSIIDSNITRTTIFSSGFILSNTSVENYVDIFDDSIINNSIGTKATIVQYGTGKTIIVPNSANVIIHSANGLNLISQYATAELVKVFANTWVAYGNLGTT